MDNKALATTIGLLAGSIVVVKLTFAVLGAVNDIPFLGNIFELVGMAYTLKLIATNLKADNRQQSISELQETLEQVGLVEQVQTVTNVIKSAVKSVSSISTTVDNPINKKEESITGWDKAETSVNEDEKVIKPVLGAAFTRTKVFDPEEPSEFYVLNEQGRPAGCSKPFATERASIPEQYLDSYDVVEYNSK
jgi:hypothetical protein